MTQPFPGASLDAAMTAAPEHEEMLVSVDDAPWPALLRELTAYTDPKVWGDCPIRARCAREFRPLVAEFLRGALEAMGCKEIPLEDEEWAAHTDLLNDPRIP